MKTSVNEPVSVKLVFQSAIKKTYPCSILWRGRLYQIQKIGLHHTYYQGRVLFHVFSVSDGNLFFRLLLNSESLHWWLEEISDGETE